MATLDTFYWNNPIATIDQASWQLQYPEVNLRFRNNSVYTPLVQWTSELNETKSSRGTVVTELIAGDTDVDEIPLMATTLDAMGVDSRSRTFGYGNYAGKVQLNKKSNIFNQWKVQGGGNDWRPLLRGVLGDDVIKKHELLSRNIFLKGPTTHWTYGGNATSIATIDSADTFSLETVIDWNFRLGQTGAPLVPGDSAKAKLCIIPPGVTYAIRKSLAAASNNEAAMFRDVSLYGGNALNYEIGTFSSVRFVEAPSDEYGMNPAVLYNVGAITKQWGVTAPIKMNDGAPDPETTKVDTVWAVGQKAVTHYIQLESYTNADFAVNDVVTIHTARTAAYGVTGGVDPLSGRTIQRRIVAVDDVNKRLTFDRPILFNYDVPMTGSSVTGNTLGTFYAWVTKGANIGMCLALGSLGGVLGAVAEPLTFYEPVPVDDRMQIWRFVYDMTLGWNVWEPNLFEVHFCAVKIPKVGGTI